MKRESKRNLSLLFLFFSIPILFNTCDTTGLNGYWKYEFVNESSYTVYITLNQKYRLDYDDKSTPYTSEISLYSYSSYTVYIKDDSVDFAWTTSSESNNRYIYTVADGSKVTFRKR
jgi:hypothetical protein